MEVQQNFLSVSHYRLTVHIKVDRLLRMVLLIPLGNFADTSYLNENSNIHQIRDVCTPYAWMLVCYSLLYKLPYQIKKTILKFELQKKGIT